MPWPPEPEEDRFGYADRKAGWVERMLQYSTFGWVLDKILIYWGPIIVLMAIGLTHCHDTSMH